MTGRSIAVEDKRRQILEAAVRVFARSGYHGARVGDIAEEAGVAHGLLYHDFPSKEEVLAPHLRATHGYEALWALLGVPILAVIPLVMSLERVESDADRASGPKQPEAPHLAV